MEDGASGAAMLPRLPVRYVECRITAVRESCQATADGFLYEASFPEPKPVRSLWTLNRPSAGLPLHRFTCTALMALLAFNSVE